MKRAIVIALLLVTPAFAATMNTFALQPGNTFIQLNPGDLPSLTDSYAGSAMQNTHPNALVFVTSLVPTGPFTISFSLTIGGQQFVVEGTPCSSPSSCKVDADFTMPTFYQPTKGTLVVNVNGAASTFDFMFRSAVPEPTTLILLGTGLGAIGWRRARRSRAGNITV